MTGMNRMAIMTEVLLKILTLAPGSQTAAELRDSLQRSGIKVEEFQILQELRRLQGEGIVRIDGTRWRLLKLHAGISGPAPARVNNPTRSQTNASGVSVAAANTTSTFISPPAPPVGRWGLFRRLCRYYMDCLLQEEAPQLRSYLNNQDDTWIVAPNVPWGRLSSNGGFGISLDREQAAFQRNRVRRGEEECVYLCYPLSLIKTRDDLRFIVPLFAQPMQADWRAGVLHLEPDGPIAVNGAWLEYAFKQRGEREAFLRAMGFLNNTDGDEDENADSGPIGPKDFAQLAQEAALYVHVADRFAEHIRPMQLGPAPNWNNAEPGLYNTAVLTLGPRLRYTRSLLRDLRDISEKLSDEELDQTALAALFPHDIPPPPENSTLLPVALPASTSLAFGQDHLVQTRLLHSSQRAAVINSLGKEVSVVTGPPGTGKSEVVASMLVNRLLRGQPALFASKNHQALDAVLPRLNDAAIGSDLIIQTSSRELAQRQNYLGKLQSLLARPPRPDAIRGDELRQQFAGLFREQRNGLDDIATIQQARTQYESVNHQLAEFRKLLPLGAQSDDALARWPQSITRESIDILHTELQQALALPSGLIQKIWYALRRDKIAAGRQVARKHLLELPSPFADRAFPDASATSETWNDFFAAWRTWAEASRVLALVRGCEQRIAQLPTADDCNRRLANAQQMIEERTREWMAWAAGGLPNSLSPSDRQALANLRAGIQNWGADRFAKGLKKHFPLILRAFPLWSVSNLSARSALPLIPALFDLVIVDEASQCDIASVIPLLARSKHAVFAGDPMQLKHVSNLDVAVEQTLLQQYNLTEADLQRFTYRVNSAFDLADANAAVPNDARVRLDLHFRSHELIADYCNEAFYANTLTVVTLTERLNIPAGMKPGIHWTHIAGKLEAGITGAWCADEITAIQRELAALAASGYRGTIGVVTPFRQQMIRIKDALESSNSLPADFMERVRFLAATAHGFQGDERDLILFSLCGGTEMPRGSTIFLRENPNLFNVAVSRARAVLHVVGNRDWALDCGVSFIEKLARRTLPATAAMSRARDPYQSPWEKTLALALQESGIKVVPQYPIAGRFLDLGILHPVKIDVEVDGESTHRTAGGGRKDDDYWRDLQLQSLGWKVCRFWVYELREDMSRCVDKIQSLLKQ
jgi:very-short-patch-repair endonuclease